jgi:dienelactone hydrolase
MAQTATVNSSGSDMKLYDVEPASTARGAVIVIQEAFGINDHIEDVCRRFAGAGYRAVAPHLFHRTGDPVIAYDDMQSVMPQLGGLSAEGLTADIDASLEYLHGAGFTDKQVGIVGFCMGGSVVVFAAAQHALGAAVTSHRSCRRHGSACSATRTRRSPWIRSSRSATPRSSPVSRPTSFATPTPVTGSTATRATRITSRRRRTAGNARSRGSTRTSRRADAWTPSRRPSPRAGW